MVRKVRWMLLALLVVATAVVANLARINAVDQAAAATRDARTAHPTQAVSTVSVPSTNGAPQATYNYNGRGQRVVKNVTKPDGTTLATTFVYDEGNHLIGEYSSEGSKEYIYADNLLVGIVVNGQLTSANPSQTVNNQLYYVETDQLGTPRDVVKPGATTADDQIVWKWDYFSSTFGLNQPEVQNLEVNLRFPGQYYDAESGLVYNGERYYDSSIGAYLQSDPLGLQGGIDTYSYVNAQPLTQIDPYGTLSFGPTCDTAQRARLTIALIDMMVQLINNACNSACTGGNCMPCDKAKRILDWYQTTAVLHCNQRGGCAQSIYPNTTNLYFTPSYINSYVGLGSERGCGCLPSTLLHEADHIYHEQTGTFSKDYWTEEYGTERETRACISCARNDFPH